MVHMQTKIVSTYYKIQVGGCLDLERAVWFEGMSLLHESASDGSPITTLSGSIADQAALFGILNRIRDLGLKLISVNCIESNLEAGLTKVEN